MLNLPSTTRVSKRIPKEAFYRHLELNARQKDEFVHVIDRITVVNSVKPSVTNIAAGSDVAEILVLELRLKEQRIPMSAIEVIAKQNANKLVFVCCFEECTAYAVCRPQGVWSTEWLKGDNGQAPAFEGADMDEIWGNVCAQVIFGRAGIDVDAEISRTRAMEKLDEAIAKLKRQHGAEKRINRRNELFKQLKEAKRERAALGEGLPWRS